jgi:hypothetical protein
MPGGGSDLEWLRRSELTRRVNENSRRAEALDRAARNTYRAPSSNRGGAEGAGAEGTSVGFVIAMLVLLAGGAGAVLLVWMFASWVVTGHPF